MIDYPPMLQEHDLINPSNKKEVICNDALKSLFKVKIVVKQV